MTSIASLSWCRQAAVCALFLTLSLSALPVAGSSQEVAGSSQEVEGYVRVPTSQGLARGPHKLLINSYDAERHLWIVDDDLHEINKFTNDGQLVMTLGERGVPGRGPNNFNRPTDIAWLPDGTFFVADGYAGTRVAKFDAAGNFLMDWGQPPVDPDNPGPYEFWPIP